MKTLFPSLTTYMPLVMNTTIPPARIISNKQVWTGRILTGLAGAFMLFDGVFKLVQPTPQPVTDSFVQLGYNPASAATVGVISLACTLLYLIPRSAALGAILLTGYLGGAVATHFRLDNPLFSHVLFPTYIALLAWGGLFLRDERIRQLFRSRQAAQSSPRA
jgi:hypothetical protein